MIKIYYSLRTEREGTFTLDADTEQESDAFFRSLSFRGLP
jgi:hypothetical protein